MRYFATFLVLILSASPVWAHKFKVFAFAEGNTIEGEAYFVGAGKASGAEITLFQNGQPVSLVLSDADGVFQFQQLTPADYWIKADAGQGHVAKYRVSAEEMGVTEQPAPAAETSGKEASPTTAVNNQGLAAIVESSVAHQLRPLREQIEQLKEERRLQDILGGVGYIFGLAGLASLLLSRKRQQALNPVSVCSSASQSSEGSRS